MIPADPDVQPQLVFREVNDHPRLLTLTQRVPEEAVEVRTGQRVGLPGLFYFDNFFFGIAVELDFA